MSIFDNLQRESEQPLIQKSTESQQSLATTTFQLMKTSFIFGLTLLGEPQHAVLNMQKHYVTNKILTQQDFEAIKGIIYRSLGLTSLNITFLVGYYKIGFFSAIASVIAFTFPNVFFMCLLSVFADDINKITIFNIILVGIRSASTAVVFKNSDLIDNTMFTNILAIFTFVMCLLFNQNNYIYFLLYLVGAVLATFTKNIKKIELPVINLNKSLSKPAVFIYIMIMIALWLLARNFDYGLIRMGQFITLMMSFTLYTSYGYLGIINGQFQNLHQNSLPLISITKMDEVMRNMFGICCILPGSDLKIIIILCIYFYGIKGLLVSILGVYAFSILLICIFIKYAKVLVESRTYRKMYQGLNTVNKGFCLLFTLRSFQAETCQRQLFVMIFLVVNILLHTVNPRRHMLIFLGVIIAFTRRFSLWFYRGIEFGEGLCYQQ